VAESSPWSAPEPAKVLSLPGAAAGTVAGRRRAEASEGIGDTRKQEAADRWASPWLSSAVTNDAKRPSEPKSYTDRESL
jgi:hypothetical protein